MRRASAFCGLIVVLSLIVGCSIPAAQQNTAIPLAATPPPPTATGLPSTATPLTPTVAPQSDGTLDTFVAELPEWSEVAPPAPVNNGVPTGAEPVTSETTAADGTLYACTTTQYSITENPSEIVLNNPDAAVLWPGALIRGSSHLQLGALELLAVSRDRRAPLGISIQGGGVLGIPDGVSTIVEQPVGSTMREGINQLVANTLGADVAVGSGASSFTSVESHSSTQALLSLGLDARYLGGEASGRLNYQRDVDEYSYTAYFVQRLFTVAIDLPEQPSALFASNVTADDLQRLGISADNLPLYIDSVSYGRILLFSFTSRDSREQIAAALEFAYNSPIGGVNGFSEADLQQTLSNARIEVFALGGPNTGVQSLIRSGELESYFTAPLAVNQVEPISFTIRNLGDNRLAQVANATEYDVRECQPVAGGLPQPIHWWTADDTLADAVGEVELGGFGGAYGAGWNGLDPADKAFVLDGTGQYLNTYPVEQIAPTSGAFALSAWINPRVTADVHTVFSQVGGRLQGGEFALRVRNGGLLELFRRPSAFNESVDVVRTPDAVIPTNQWTHVVAVYGSSSGGGGNMQLYVNGELAADTVQIDRYVPTRPRPDTDLTMTRVGASELTSDGQRRYPFNGSIDEIMVFNRALSGEEVQAMYQNFARYKE